MERFDRLLIVLMLLPGFASLPCRAQAPEPPPAKSPPSPPAGGDASPIVPSPRRSGKPPWEKSPLELPPPAGGEVMEMKPPPLEPGDLRFPINLATALRLADARPLIVVAAQASAWVSEADTRRPRSSGSLRSTSAAITSGTTATARILVGALTSPREKMPWGKPLQAASANRSTTTSTFSTAEAASP